MKVAIINTTLLNGGDAAINTGTIEILRRALGQDTEFVCYDAQPEAAARLYPDLDIRRPVFDRIGARVPGGIGRKLALAGLLLAARVYRSKKTVTNESKTKYRLELLQVYSDFDVVVSAGGTYLVDNYRILPKVFEFLLVLALGRPLVLFTQSMGPFRSRRDRAILGWVLRRAALVMVRDERSRREALALGAREDRVVRCPDAAFALADKADARAPRPIANPPRIGVSVRDWPFFGEGGADGMARYLDAVAGFIRRAVETDDASVTLISSCQGIGEYWTDDSRTAEFVLQRLPPHIRANVQVDSAFRRPTELIDRIGSFDCVVATRMHMAILSLCAGRPVVPIAYEFKTRELFGGLRFDVPVADIETVTAAGLYDAWQAVRGADALGTGQEGWRRVAEARREALECGRFVASAIALGDYG